MSKDNPISGAIATYQKYGPNPLLTALVLGAGAYGATNFGWNSAVETFRSLARPWGRGLYGGNTPEANQAWNDSMDELKANSKARPKLSALIGALTAGGALAMFYNPRQKYGGLLSWNADPKVSVDRRERHVKPFAEVTQQSPMQGTVKTASFGQTAYMPAGNFTNQINWQQPVPLNTAQGLFQNDPFLQQDRYAMNMGTAIVNNAAIQQHTNQPTLGGIFDSAVNKIENKLTLGGIAKVGIRTAVANGAARLFTGALGAMCGLSPQSRQTLVDAGTWAGAISAILE